MPPGFGPRPPSGPPPAYLRPSASSNPAAKGQASLKGSAAKGKGGNRSSAKFKGHDLAPVDPLPSFIGAASRKRKYEIAVEKFGQGDGPSAYVWPQQSNSRGGPQQPGYPPPMWNGSPYLNSGGGDAARPTKRSKAQNYSQGPPPRTAALAVGPSPVTWITLAEGSGLINEGLPALAPLLQYNSDLQQLLSQSQNILYELNGDEPVTLTHDTEGGMFPEVVQAAMEQGLEIMSICVAMCPSEGLWAVGMGGKWKQREQAARMALCLAIAANTENIDNLNKVSANFPDFVVLCDGANIEMGPEEPHGHMTSMQQPPPSRGRRAHSTPSLPPTIAQDVNNGMQPKGTLPRDTPFWIEISGDEAPEVLMTLPPEALVVSTDGKTRRALYTNADKAITLLLGEDKDEIEFHDDANWENFPMIGARLTEIAPAEECMTVAVCSSRDVWAVGVSMQSRNRLNAAKLALATSLALKLEETGEDCDLSEVPSIEEFVEEARRAREG